jgi:hypothetical protein
MPPSIGTERHRKKVSSHPSNGVDNRTQSIKLGTSKSEGLLDIVEISTINEGKKQC